MSKAIPFVRLIDEKKGIYEVCEEAVDLFENVPSPFGVVAIVGKYRTGKSFFMNRCLLRGKTKSKKGAFPVGNTVQACTKGLWLCNAPLEGGTMPIFVIDTEGIGALEATNTHDTSIFSMALLFSSFFIYNSLNAIDEEAINQLSLVANVCKQIRLTADKEATPEELGKEVFPPLFWMVRDFSLQLKDEQDRDISSNEYLNRALSESTDSSSGEGREDKNRLRKCLRECFPRRACATLIRPCNDERELQMMQNGDAKLKPMFQQQLDWIRNYVLGSTLAKSSSNPNIPMTGKSFIAFVRSIVEAVNRGTIPVIRDSWSLLYEIHCRDAVDVAEKRYNETISKLTQQKNLNLNESSVISIWKEGKGEALSLFREKCDSLEKSGTDISKWRAMLLAKIEDDKKRLLEELRKLSEYAISSKISEIDSFFSSMDCMNGDPGQLDQYERELNDSLLPLLHHESPCSCGTRTVLAQLSTKCWCWLRNMGSTSLHMESTMKSLREEREGWMEKVANARNEQKEAIEHEQQKYNELQIKLTSLNDSLSKSLTEKEAEISLHEDLVREQEEIIEELREDSKKTPVVVFPEGDQEEEEFSRIREELEKKVQDSKKEQDKLQEKIQESRSNFVNQIRTIREESDQIIQHAKTEYQRKVDEEQQKMEISNRKQAQQLETIKKKEHQMDILNEKVKTLVESLKRLEKSHEKTSESYKAQWSAESTKQAEIMYNLQQQRLTEQLEWSAKIREADSKAATTDARLKDCKRKLDKSDPTKVKRLKTDNNLLSHTLAKAETEKQWIRKELDRTQNNLDKITKTNDELLTNYHVLQREKEMEILNLTLSYEKQLSSRKF